MADFPIPTKKVYIPTFASEVCGGVNPKCYQDLKQIVRDINQRKDGKYDDYIDAGEAFLFIKNICKFGHAPELKNGLLFSTYETLKKNFFPGVQFYGSGNPIDPLDVIIESCNDGDTCKPLAYFDKVTNDWVGMKTRFRIDGIDTPESSVNSKYQAFEDFIWKLLKDENKIPGDREKITRLMVSDRIIYGGKLAGLATKGVVAWASANKIPFSADVSYSRASLEPAECNTIDLIDKYDRVISRLMVGRMGDKTNLVAKYIAEGLPLVMGARPRGQMPTSDSPVYGMDLYELYSKGTGALAEAHKRPIGIMTDEGKNILNFWKADGKFKEIFKAFAPETLPDPSKMFSLENCKKLADEWVKFTQDSDEYRNDVQLMLIFLGLGYSYPKYRNRHTDKYLVADLVAYGYPEKLSKKLVESVSVGRVGEFPPLPEGPAKKGLWGDRIFEMMQPNQYLSELFSKYGEDLARGKDLMPPDCCKILQSEGKDVFHHCE